MIRRIADILAPRADVLEAAIGLVLVVAGVAMVSVAGALVVAGLALVAFALWPLLRRP